MNNRNMKYRVAMKQTLLDIKIGETLSINERFAAIFRVRISQLKNDGIGLWETTKIGSNVIIKRVS